VKNGLTSRPATQEDEEAIAKLLFCMYQEVGRCPLNPQKACMEIVDTVRNHACFVVEHNGMIVGTVGISPLPGGLFYSDAPWLIDKWFYIMPSYRPENLDGGAFSLLLDEVRTLCTRTRIPCFLRIFNDKRTRARDDTDRIGRSFCCYPAGATIEIHPAQPKVLMQ
jgi:hypothetical protein